MCAGGLFVTHCDSTDLDSCNWSIWKCACCQVSEVSSHFEATCFVSNLNQCHREQKCHTVRSLTFSCMLRWKIDTMTQAMQMLLVQQIRTSSKHIWNLACQLIWVIRCACESCVWNIVWFTCCNIQPCSMFVLLSVSFATVFSSHWLLPAITAQYEFVLFTCTFFQKILLVLLYIGEVLWLSLGLFMHRIVSSSSFLVSLYFIVDPAEVFRIMERLHHFQVCNIRDAESRADLIGGVCLSVWE